MQRNDYKWFSSGKKRTAIKNTFSEIITKWNLFLCDDLNNVLRKIINSLVSNGFFIATIPTQENFNSLKEAMIKTDIEVYGGAYNRFNKFFNLEEIIKLLKQIYPDYHFSL